MAGYLILPVLNNQSLITANTGGASRDRTDDPLLAKQVLSQLSYGPLLVYFALCFVALVARSVTY